MIDLKKTAHLKIAVGVMTALIVVGLGLVIYGMTREKEAAKTDEKAFTATMNISPDASVKLMTAYKDSIALYVASPDGDNIYFIGPEKGTLKGRIVVTKNKQ